MKEDILKEAGRRAERAAEGGPTGCLSDVSQKNLKGIYIVYKNISKQTICCGKDTA